MSDEQVDLNAMIKSDKRREHFQRQKRRQQRRYDRRDIDRRDRSRDDRRQRRSPQQRRENRSRRDEYRQSRQQLVVQTYAISASGFISDVSLDDILKLTKGKKIINIKAFFQREDGQPLQAGVDNAMTVIINFVQKQQADDFIKQYADKKFDGKTPLQFQFRRGIVSRRPKMRQNTKQKRQNNKQEEDVQKGDNK